MRAGSGWRPGPFRYEVFGPQDESGTGSYAMSFGASVAPRGLIDRLKSTAARNGHVDGAVGQAIEIIRRTRASPGARALIGERMGSLVVKSHLEAQPEGRYFGKRGVTRHFFPSLVTRHGWQQDVQVDLGSNGRPCSCGSGAPYAACHGRERPRVIGTPPKTGHAGVPALTPVRPRESRPAEPDSGSGTTSDR